MTKYLVGIGNPDPEYQNTHHNIGWMFIDFIAKKYGFNDFAADKKINALVAEGKIEKTKVVLIKPLTYVNKSGDTVGKLKSYYKAKTEEILIAHDDLDIEFGESKMSFNKNSGGHKGVDSIIKALKTKEFHRIRIGIAVKALDKARQQSDKKRDEFVKDFVLSKLTKREDEIVKKLFKDIHDKLLPLLK